MAKNGDITLGTYKIWAPPGALWAEWAKPVLFTNWINHPSKPLELPELDWVKEVYYDTAIIVDQPGEVGVAEGLALARLGYRPVPLYNGVNGPITSSVVRVEGLKWALFQGADQLAKMNIRPDAPPAFLLDANRMEGAGKQPGKFDNRWCVFAQDMPSAACLLERGIASVLVRATDIRADLSHVLKRYQDAGIGVVLCNGRDPIVPVTVHKPSRFKSLSYRYRVSAGLMRNAAGGFGAMVPEPMEYNSGVRYYGYG